MEVAPRYILLGLFTLFTLLTLFKLFTVLPLLTLFTLVMLFILLGQIRPTAEWIVRPEYIQFWDVLKVSLHGCGAQLG